MRNRFIIILLITISLTPVITQASIANTKIQQATEKFQKADKNADGKLTPEEAKTGMPRVFKNFARIDRDKKGYVTLEDIKAALSPQ